MSNEKKILFKTQFTTLERKGIDLSNPYEETFIELEPYARNDKGEFLNDSPFPKLVSNGKVNVQERIDSFRDDVDLYKILDKVLTTGDISYLDRKAGFYGDISDLPDNYNDLQDYYKNVSKEFNTLPDDLKDLIRNGASDDDIQAYMNDLISKQNNINNVQKNGQKENIKESETVDNGIKQQE